ncbi:MAG: hypothetical protein ABI318_03270 [Chthoniobacteraceae bacterium]
MELSKQNGLAAYFDILGFTSIVASDDFDKAVRLVDQVVSVLPKMIDAEIARMRGGPSVYRNDTRSIVFADSILITHSIPAEELLEPFHWYSFLRVCSWLMSHMLTIGLPIRGAVSFGEFFVKDHCFAGKPIAECHNCSSKTEWAGCVLVPSIQKIVEGFAPEWNILEQVCVPYGAPFKKERAEEPAQIQDTPSLVLKWSHYHPLHPDDKMPNIHESVLKSFRMHGKAGDKLSPDVQLKADETVKYLERVNSLFANSNREMPEHLRRQIFTTS